MEGSITNPATLVPLWVPFATALLGGILGFAFGVWKDVLQNRRRVANCWRAVYAEFRICTQMAEGFINAGIPTPSYRLPAIAYRSALPELLMGAGLTVNQAQDLVLFFTNVDAFNRGLDYAQDADNRGQPGAVAQQSAVNFSRARKHLLPGTDESVGALRVFVQFSASD